MNLIFLSVYLSVCLSACLSVCVSVCLSVYLSVCLSICLSVCLSVGAFPLRLTVHGDLNAMQDRLGQELTHGEREEHH